MQIHKDKTDNIELIKKLIERNKEERKFQSKLIEQYPFQTFT